MKALSVSLLVRCCLLLATSGSFALAQHWVEQGDAPDPDRAAQRTLDPGPVRTLSGAIDSSTGDSRDAFCLRIPDPALFFATTDSALLPSAGADSGVTLSLLDAHGLRLSTSVGSEPGSQTLVSPPGPTDSPSRRSLLALDEYVLVVSASDASYSVALAGAFGCGTLDVVLAVDEPKMDRYCLGNPRAAGNFHCHGVTGDTVATSGLALGDLDDDGDLDAVFATSEAGDPNRVCPGDSVGRFSFDECSPVGSAGASSRSVAIEDLDGDLDLDVVFANAGAPPMACLGDGSLGFSCLPVEASPRQSRGVALGHVDDDGNLDAVFANLAEPSRACFGDGAGGFSSCVDINEPGDFQYDRALTLGHFDGGGNLDVAFATILGGSICLGDGTGTFTCSSLGGAVSDGTGVAAGLLNDDAHLDLVFTQSFDVPRACLGDGLGGFSCLPLGVGHTFGIQSGVVLADFDNEGSLDVAVSAVAQESTVCFGDGAGSFANCRPINENFYRAKGLAVGPLAPAVVGQDDFETGDLRAWAASMPDG